MVRFSWLFSVVALVVVLFGGGIAGAGDGTTVDVGPVVDTLLGSLAAAVMTLAGWALARLAKRLGLEADGEVRRYLETAIYNAVAFAVARLRDEGKSITLDVKSEIVARATSYVIARVPDAVKRFGLDEASIGHLVEARLPRLDAATPVGS